VFKNDNMSTTDTKSAIIVILSDNYYRSIEI